MTAAAVDEPVHITNTTTAHVVLPAKLSQIKKANDFPSTKLCWNSSEELFSILISFEKHKEWFADRIPVRPPNGSMFLFNRLDFKDYRKDGYTWKKRQKGTTTREDHSKLKVQGINCVHVLYTHSDIIPTFHRRFYWLIQNPDIVLVHYVNLIEDLTDPDPVYSFVTAQRKENILSEIESMYVGILQHYIPDIQVTEENSPTSVPSPSTHGNKSAEKVFKICIVPKPNPPPSPRKGQQSKTNKTMNGLPINNSSSNHIQPGSATHWVSIPHKGPMPCIGSAINNRNNQGIASSITSPCQINTWIMPTCQPGINQYLTASGTVTSSLNVPIGYRPTATVLIPKPAGTSGGNNHQNGSTQQGMDINKLSNGQLGSQAGNINPTFLVSASYAGGNSHSGVLQTQGETRQGNSPILMTPSPSLNSPDRPFHINSPDIQPCVSNASSPLVFQLTPTSGTSTQCNGMVPSSVNCTVNSSALFDANSKDGHPTCSTSSTTAPAAVTTSNLTNGAVVRSDSLHSSSTSSITARLSPAAELGSSPSSDYGSYISEAGTRLSCSGSESLSDHYCQSTSQEGIFDGPFRIPAAPLGARHSYDMPASPQDSPKPSNAGASDDAKHNSNVTMDSQHLVDLGFDVSELSPLEPFGDGILSNYDLSSVFPEYFGSVPDMDQREQHQNDHEDDSLTGLVSEGSSEAQDSHMQTESSKDCDNDSTKDAASFIPPSPASVGAANASITVSCQSPVADVVMTTADASTSNMPPDLCPHLTNTVASATGCRMSRANQNAPEIVETSRSNAARSDDQQSTGSTGSFLQETVPGSARITDFSPEWSYTEGRVKIIVTGEWYSTDMSYTCLFDGCSVEASLVQIGVLRCYCPPHEPGLVTLQVACNGFIVSNACVFEYRACDTPSNAGSRHEWLTMDESRFKLAMLDRLERLEASLGLNPQPSPSATGSVCTTFEDRIIRACKALFTSMPAEGSIAELKKPYRGMSLLHLAAALGFTRLLRELKALKPNEEANPLRQEIDYTRRDEFSCTPLMWACGLGHREAVYELLVTDMNSLLTPDARGRMPLQLARDRGYFEVVDCIEEFFMASPSRQSALMNSSLSDDEADITDSPPRSPIPTPSYTNGYLSNMNAPAGGSHHSNAVTHVSGYHSNVTTPVNTYHSNTPISVATQETNFTDRACSPMAVDESQSMGVPLGHALVQVHAMLNEAELEADLETAHLQNIAARVQGQLTPVHEEAELLPSGGWVSAGGRFRSFSSASSQSSPLTPSSKSSLSPGSPGNFLNSPHSSPAVAPDTKEFHEFLCSSKKLLEKNFSDLTLTDLEQRELYQAALIIQEAYRSYKTRRQQRDEEMDAAVLIQNHYRRYKQYAVLKKMTQAALIIQNQYRAYREHEQFKKSRRAAAIIQNHFRIYRQRRQSQKRRDDYKSKQQEARFMRQVSNRSNTS